MEERKALPVHHTDVSMDSWDGPAMEAKLRNDGGAEYLRQAYAWVDPGADPNTKSAYKFIHHEVSRDGDIGPANIQACRTGIAVLNGARGGADIPESDREGVWQHLAAHIRDAGLTPPELRNVLADQIDRIMGDVEIRNHYRGELRVEEDGDSPILIGVPGIPYGQESEDLGGFFELVNPAALNETLGGYDVVCCRDHEDHLVLGRVSAGTLRLENTTEGLNYQCILPDTTYARDLIESVRRGDVKGNSFRFQVLEDEWRTDKNGRNIREILKMELYEVGPVTMPAYPSTSISLRSLLRGVGVDVEKLGIAVRRIRGGNIMTEDIATIKEAISTLSQYIPSRGARNSSNVQQGLGVLREKLKLLTM